MENTNKSKIKDSETKIKKDQYKKILNNLLNINANDTCIFGQIDNKQSFDVYKKFGKEFFQKIISSEYFSISLKENDLLDFKNEIETANEQKEIEAICQTYNLNIPENILNQMKKDLKEDKLLKLKNQLISWSEVEGQKSSYKWKLYLNKARNLNEQNNLWPIHLGFLYLTLRVDNKTIQAPLFFKEVNIQIKNSRISLTSIGDIKINEKLVYFLETQGFLFDVDFNFDKMSILKLYETITKTWNQNFNIPNTLIGNIPNFKSEEILNEKIDFFPGVSLGFFEPTGSHLRKTMIKIIEEDLLDGIIDVEFDKNIYKNNINYIMFKPNFSFYKIQHSNYSQDKAVVSALNQNTIIWGPPGTGKSQTISNIITNILMFNKTALVVSQKKAALVVLKERMEELGIFCLFVLTDREMNKKAFYEPLKEYIDYLENLNINEEDKFITLISSSERKYLEILKEIKSNQNNEINLDLFSKFLKDNDGKFDQEKFEKILELDENLVYDLETLRSQKNFNKYMFAKNSLKRENVFVKYSKNLKKTTKLLKENFIEDNLDLNEFTTQKNKIDLSLIQKINEINSFDLNKYNSKVNDPKKLKIIISKMIVNKMKNLSKEMKTKYNKFALDTRTASLDINTFITKHADIIKIIFPIIITSPETDLHCWGQNEFDYALLDESSQIFLEKAIPILFLAKIKILAGDDQQMQPSRWFSIKTEGDSEFGNIESILDYAKAKGVYSILLDKNYRSKYASLMSFNSKMFYKSQLDVVDSNVKSNEIPIEVINVNGIWDNSINRDEIEEALKITNENLNKYNKIILLCFNAAQMGEIEKEIFKSYPEMEKAIFEGKLLLRNVENIQGDEADLVIVSVVYDKTTKLHASYVVKKNGKYALNVAISRAKDKMIVLKSIYADDVVINENSDDAKIFKEWLKFLDLKDIDKKNYVQTQNKEENTERENNFKSSLISKFLLRVKEEAKDGLFDNFKIVENFSIGTITIDVAILDKTRDNAFVLGFAIDDYNYFDDFDKYLSFKDKKNFFTIKKYPIIILSILNLNQQIDKTNQRLEKYLEKKLYENKK
ncbi:MAG: AAA domain-containing protein [Metamycoplasmataceae bacterium]